MVGQCINWHNLLTEKLISGRVNITYCRLPQIVMYLVASSRDKGELCYLDNGDPITISVAQGSQVAIPTFLMICNI